MTPKLCKYGCLVMLDAWDDDAKKYREAGSGGLHTKERCEEMKAKSRVQQGEKNHNHDNHGNEIGESKFSTATATTGGNTEIIKGPYVDHTLAATAKLKLKVLTDPTPEGLALLYNNFGDSHNIRFSQYHVQGALYTIAVFFEEVPLKQ